MYNEIKKFLKRYPSVVRLVRNINRVKKTTLWWLSDVRSALLSRSTEIKKTPYGFKLVGSNSIHHVGMQNGSFEVEEIRQFTGIFEKVDIFIDVGANIGFYSCLARQAGLHVVAVEPLTRNLKYLYKNIVVNEWEDTEVFPLGLADKSGVATLFGGSSTGASLIRSWAGASKMFRESISLTTLDILISQRFSNQRIFIKIDVEGAEYSALLGSVKVMDMQPKPTWVVEICLNEYHPDGVNPHFQNTFDLFWKHGYEARTADQHNRLISADDIEKWVNMQRCESGTINYKFSAIS